MLASPINKRSSESFTRASVDIMTFDLQLWMLSRLSRGLKLLLCCGHMTFASDHGDSFTTLVLALNDKSPSTREVKGLSDRRCGISSASSQRS